MAVTQRTLIHELPDPEGFQYKDAVLSPNQERVLIKEFSRLPFKEFEFRGFLGKRRTVSSATWVTSTAFFDLQLTAIGYVNLPLRRCQRAHRGPRGRSS
jgi:hypothetical protein